MERIYDDQSNLLFVGVVMIHRLLLLGDLFDGLAEYAERLKPWRACAERVVMSRLDSPVFILAILAERSRDFDDCVRHCLFA